MDGCDPNSIAHGTNNMILDNCYMNGKISAVDERAGALIGFISTHNSFTTNINIGETERVYYNKAYSWTGYNSVKQSKTSILHNYQGKETSYFEKEGSTTPLDNLKNEILEEIIF